MPGTWSNLNEEISLFVYERIAAAVPEGTNRGEALKAACKLVADVLSQFNDEEFDTILYSAAIGIINVEYRNIILLKGLKDQLE